MGRKDERHTYAQKYQDRLYDSMDEEMNQGKDGIYQCNTKTCTYTTRQEGMVHCPECKVGILTFVERKQKQK